MEGNEALYKESQDDRTCEKEEQVLKNHSQTLLNE